LSVQNGILVTKADRFPLLIDPQGQALTWLLSREGKELAMLPKDFGETTSINNKDLRRNLKFCMQEGRPLLIEGVVDEIDPMFDPVLQKNLKKKGRSLSVMMGDEECSFDKNFRLYFFTKIANPLFSPELSAMTTVVDFSVTIKGLEDQLLSRVIQHEQEQLEIQRMQLIQEVNEATIKLQRLDAELLECLAASKGNLLDDIRLINILANTKKNSKEVAEKIEASKKTEIVINTKREQYRPVAGRGAILYFTIVDTSLMNCMYQTSLAMFLTWFKSTMEQAPEAPQVKQRISILIQHLTYNVYQNVKQGLFVKDKLTYTLLQGINILKTETTLLNQKMLTTFLQAGGNLTPDQVPKKPYIWLEDPDWRNIVALSTGLPFFSDLRNKMQQSEVEWKAWHGADNPEDLPIPNFEERLNADPSGHFLRLLLLRSARQDRLTLASSNFISQSMGEKFVTPVPFTMESVYKSTSPFIPSILLLTPGADPTAAIESLAKKLNIKVGQVSMGEGQAVFAEALIESSMETGGWCLLQNCHLGLGFMMDLPEMIAQYQKEMEAGERKISENYRLWITCEAHPKFPISLLQLSVKVTMEPPKGLKAGLQRSYTSMIDEERLNRVSDAQWRDIIYCLAFSHSIVQERRKFGAIGWCIPYEFNQPDLEASLTFLEKHFFASSQGISWPTIQYMICEVQYGGKITDDCDRALFNTFGRLFLVPDIFTEGYELAPPTASGFKWTIPKGEEISSFHDYIDTMAINDTPIVFGLHANADITLGMLESNYLLDQITAVQPKNAGSGAGATREDIVYEDAMKKLKQLPASIKIDDVRDMVAKRPKSELATVLAKKDPGKVDGFTIPLNVFLFQEVDRLQGTIREVRKTLQDLMLAIRGEIIMTPVLAAALDAMFEGRAPVHWYLDAGGNEISWQLPTLALWFVGLQDREKQLTTWLKGSRPNSYWMTGFFNPQGFLTATRQEITRRNGKWALDDVVLRTTLTDYETERRVRSPCSDGVYVHGLFLEGAGLDTKTRCLRESKAADVYVPMPVIEIRAMMGKDRDKLLEGGKYYKCPVYKSPRRTDIYRIYEPYMKSEVDPDHWCLRGVAMLCWKP